MMKRFLLIAVMLFWCNVGVTKILPNATPEEQYKFALSFIKIGDYETAEYALKEFIEINPNHELAGNAQYWYAETFRVREHYKEAAIAYLDGYQLYPKSPKAPVNLLKLGVMLVVIGEWNQGCSMINGVESQYPKALSSVLIKVQEEYKNYQCQNSANGPQNKYAKKGNKYTGDTKISDVKITREPERKKVELATMIDDAKKTCKELGFTPETEKFADCSLKLYSQSVELAAKSNQTVVMQPQSSGSNTMTIYDPRRDSRILMKKAQRMLSGACTLGIDC